MTLLMKGHRPSMKEIYQTIEQLERYAAERGMHLYIQYDVDQCKYQFLFEYRGINLRFEIDQFKKEEDMIEELKRVYQETTDALEKLANAV